MAGLYRRFKELKPSPPPAPTGQAPSQQPDLHDELKAEGAKGISFDEQVEIIGQINELLQKNRLQVAPETFAFTPKKRGGAIPLLINLGAVALTLVVAVLLLYFFNRSERSLVSRSAVVLTAEGRLIQALKKESEEQLGQKNREIAQIKDRLDELARERDKLKLDSQAQIRRREAELKEALERELAAERQKLEREGRTAAAVERELKALESRLAEDNQRQLASYRRQAEGELEAKDAALASMARQYTESLKAFQQEKASLEERLKSREAELTARLQEETAAAESEKARFAGELARLSESRRKEQLVFDQILSGYEKVMGALKGALYEEALKDLDAIRELLSQESVLSLPAIRQRLPVERFVLDSLRRLVDLERAAVRPEAEKRAPSAAELALAEVAKTVEEADRKAQAGAGPEALALYEKAIQQLPETRKSYASLSEAARKEAERERKVLQQELARYQAEEKRRQAIEAQLRSLRERYAAAGKGSSETQQAQVLALLETKLRVRQVLASEPARSQHPGLYEELEQYLDALGREQRLEGQTAALQDAVSLLEGLAQKSPRADTRRLKGDYTGAQRELFARFWERLQALME